MVAALDAVERRQALADLLAQGRFTLRVRGRCMAPVLRDGVRVRVDPAARLWPGDLVVFAPPTQTGLRVHRLLGWYYREGRWLAVCQADNAPRADAPVPRHRLLGRARARVPLRDRARALQRFGRFVLGRVRARLSRPPGG